MACLFQSEEEEGGKRTLWTKGDVLNMMKEKNMTSAQAAHRITESLVRVPFERRTEAACERIAARKEKYRKKISNLLREASGPNAKGFERKQKHTVCT